MEELRKIIKEIIGKQIDIYNSTEEITNEMVDLIIRDEIKYPRILDGYEHSFATTIRPDSVFKQSTKISQIKIAIDFTNSKENKISGTFMSGKTVLLSNDLYQIEINVEVKINNDPKLYKKEAESIIAHELNHAFVYIKKLNKQSKTSILNKTKNSINRELGVLLDKSPALKEFMDMFYLALPEEMEARIQETATQLKYINEPHYEQTIEFLRRFQPIRDSKRMRYYKLDEINKESPETLKIFVATFNANLKEYSIGINIKSKNDVDAFFKYWSEIINYNGDILFKKIMKLVAEKHNTFEGEIYNGLDDKLLYEISGISNLFNQS